MNGDDPYAELKDVSRVYRPSLPAGSRNCCPTSGSRPSRTEIRLVTGRSTGVKMGSSAAYTFERCGQSPMTPGPCPSFPT